LFVLQNEYNKNIDNNNTRFIFIDHQNLDFSNIDHELKEGIQKIYRLINDEYSIQVLVQKRSSIDVDFSNYRNKKDGEKEIFFKDPIIWDLIKDMIAWHFRGSQRHSFYLISDYLIYFPYENKNPEAFEFFKNIYDTYMRMDYYQLDKLFVRTYHHKTYFHYLLKDQ